MFELAYIEAMPLTENAFAQWGTLGHWLFEQYYSGKLTAKKLGKEYKKKYKSVVTHSFSQNPYTDLAQSYFERGKEYFTNFQDPFKGNKILGVEQEIDIKIDKYPFTGYIDLIAQDKSDIIIVDHKSKSKFSSNKEKRMYLHQLYIYSIYIYEKYGVYPSKLVYNMFRADNILYETFNEEELNKTKEWSLDIIENIYQDTQFNAKPNEFFCNTLCGVRYHCPFFINF